MAAVLPQTKFAPARVRAGEAERITTPPISFWKDAWRRFRANPLAVLGLVMLAVIAVAAIVGPELTPYSYSDQSLLNRDKPPSAEHWFGTDNLGRDLFTRVLFGARISLTVAVAGGVMQGIIGVVYGAVAGLRGGTTDNFMMRIVDIIDTIPLTLYVILLMVVMGPGMKSILIAIGITYWTRMARLVRAQVLSLKEQEFMLAARALGASMSRLIWRHLVPNTVGPIIVALTFEIPSVIFTEAFLSYIGLGVSAPMASWGVLASEGVRSFRSYPWQMTFPALAIVITMLSFNFVGDGLRDALDPKLRR
ncbi:ABC transporter permease [Caldinitratiruptor microaerophilus]|uniref:Oligopeptide transport system permease protein OppC n=1 Tax=Caldinitratiruptor microaerophilus TaxID=671077 RepID=A0AA35G9J4_9FIRM|nr:ABC transporter permease [Caldinitratiruptor microaerophilus]BDG62151.1 oligopeptide transport system permease protein OppC [Caldinitratiruptor microaerophilus]